VLKLHLDGFKLRNDRPDGLPSRRRSLAGAGERAGALDSRPGHETWDDDPRPYVWTKTADQIPESIAT
jgi:hypothetical protein